MFIRQRDINDILTIDRINRNKIDGFSIVIDAERTKHGGFTSIESQIKKRTAET